MPTPPSMSLTTPPAASLTGSSLPPILRVSPEKYLIFRNVRTTSITSSISLTNVSEGPAAFKVKTTAPKNYLVRPSAGVIAVNQVMEIQIILQPLHPSADNESPDRFLIQSTPVPPSIAVEGIAALPPGFWNQIEKGSLFEQRLTVVLQKPAADEEINATISSNPNNGGGMGIGNSHSISAANNTISNSGSTPPAVAVTSNSNDVSSASMQSRRPGPQQSGSCLGIAGSGGGLVLPSVHSVSAIGGVTSNNAPPPSSMAVSGTLGAGVGTDIKYQELMQYCLAVEGQKSHQQKEIETLRNQLQALIAQRPTDHLHAHVQAAGMVGLDGSAAAAASAVPKAVTFYCTKCGTKNETLMMTNDKAAACMGVPNGAVLSTSAQQRFELWHVVAIVIAVVFALRVVNFF